MTPSTAADIHALLRPMDTPTVERLILIAKAVLELRNSESAVSEAMERRTSAVVGLSTTITNLDKQARATAQHSGPWATPRSFKAASEALAEHVINNPSEEWITKTLAMSFEAGLPTVRAWLKAFPKAISRKDVGDWMVKHARELQEYYDNQSTLDPEWFTDKLAAKLKSEHATIVAGNKPEDKSAVSGTVPEHVLNRKTKVEIEPNPNAWVAVNDAIVEATQPVAHLDEHVQASAKRKRKVMGKIGAYARNSKRRKT